MQNSLLHYHHPVQKTSKGHRIPASVARRSVAMQLSTAADGAHRNRNQCRCAAARICAQSLPKMASEVVLLLLLRPDDRLQMVVLLLLLRPDDRLPLPKMASGVVLLLLRSDNRLQNV